MQDFDKLWNYKDPAGTEVKFREALANSSPEKNLSYHLQLLTQIARTYSLRFMFDDAHKLLDEVEAALPVEPEVAHARYHLERGRTLNWEKKIPEAKRHFEEAELIGRNLNELRYAMDALHMLAIVATPDEACRINEEAIILAESSDNEQAKGWLGALYNNLGWDYFGRKEYEKAQSLFLRSLKWREDRKDAAGTFIAKWCVGRVLRALGKNDDALKVQLALFEESVTAGKQDGYVSEELGELFLLKGDKLKSAFHFEKAYELLSQDEYAVRNESERLERMKKMSKVDVQAN